MIIKNMKKSGKRKELDMHRKKINKMQQNNEIKKYLRNLELISELGSLISKFKKLNLRRLKKLKMNYNGKKKNQKRNSINYWFKRKIKKYQKTIQKM